MKKVVVGLVAAVFCINAAPAAQTEKKAQADAKQLICKTDVETGSLVKKKKRCFTRSDWARIAEANQKGTQNLQDSSRGGPFPSN